MGKQFESAPFAILGEKLKVLRQSRKETIAEAAGAVEIAEDELKRIEEGFDRPSEEILMLLISHFGMKDDDALGLWELAGYDQEDTDEPQADHGSTKTITLAIALDPRVMYSDQVQITGNAHGVVFTFMQPGGGPIPNMPVSRVGMSREQAKKMLVVLRDTLDQLDKHGPKDLPPHTTSS